MKLRHLSASILLAAIHAVAAAQPVDAIIAQLNAERPSRGLGAQHGFRLRSQHPGPGATTVVRLDHTYKGVTIFGSESVVTSGQAGIVIAEEIADRRAGLETQKKAAPAGLDVRPKLKAPAAINQALKTVARGTPVMAHQAELVIYPIVKSARNAAARLVAEAELNADDLEDVVSGYRLAWLVHTRLHQGGKPVYHDTVVDAQNGRIIDRWNALQTAEGIGHSQYSGRVALSTTADGARFLMLDPQRGTGGQFGALAVTNADHGSRPGPLYAHSTNEWGDGRQYISGGSTTNANGQTAAVNAMWGLMNTYDMLVKSQGWKSLDGKDTATFINTHVNNDYDNAYYDDTCTCMYIGDGKEFTNLGSLDVIGHEMGHGVTAATAKLIYFMEYGGLNESGSDIMGEMVEAYARAGASDWVLGREISRSGKPLRYMYKPSLDGQSPDAWSSGLKRMDVHYSSGPNNRMFFFLSEGSSADPASDHYSKYLVQEPRAMTGIGMAKAFNIWFRALTTRFTRVTNYSDARKKMMAAAREIYGNNSREMIAVQRAYAAINVGKDVNE
jgi:Zn-dependent metalloprotease